MIRAEAKTRFLNMKMPKNLSMLFLSLMIVNIPVQTKVKTTKSPNSGMRQCAVIPEHHPFSTHWPFIFTLYSHLPFSYSMSLIVFVLCDMQLDTVIFQAKQETDFIQYGKIGTRFLYFYHCPLHSERTWSTDGYFPPP